MKKFRKVTVAFFLALVLIFSTIAPVVTLAAGDLTDPENLCIIAKGNDGKYYGIPTYNTNYQDITSDKVFFEISKEQYDSASAKAIMNLKIKGDVPFEVPSAKINGQKTQAGPIFREMEFRHYPAFRYLLLNSDPTRVTGVEEAVWAITLKKDCELGTVPDFAGGDKDPDPFFIHYNCEIDGQGHRVFRTGEKDTNQESLLNIGFNRPINVSLKDIIIDGEDDQQPGTPCHKGIQTTTSNSGSDNVPHITFEGGVVIQNCKVGTSWRGSAIDLCNNSSLTMKGKGNSIKKCVSEHSTGGSIYAWGNNKIDIDGATFSENKAVHGGVISSLYKNTEIRIKNAIFDKNEAKNYGGAIYTEGPIELIENTIFSANSAKHGGAICTNGDLTINGGTFEKNRASKNGGAIDTSGKTTISGASFTENKADSQGGAIDAGGNTTISGASFTENKANSEGGAIYNSAEMTIKDGSFKQNTAQWGGALASYHDININGGVFEQNTADYLGGAIYYVKGKPVINGVTFTGNKASVGGAIYLHNNIQGASVSKSTFNRNTSSHGAAIYLSPQSQLTLHNDHFEENEAGFGGAVRTGTAKNPSDKSELKIIESTFLGNKAFKGGAVFTVVPSQIVGSTFKQNHAVLAEGDEKGNPHSSGVGGAIYVMDQATQIKGCTFEENTAYGSGGALAISGVTRDKGGNITGVKPDIKATISENSVFKNNEVSVGEGGAIYTIPYAYEDPIPEEAKMADKVQAKPYANLTIDKTTLFTGNKSGEGLFNPPENFDKFTNLQFDPKSDVKHGKLTRESLLNNYDVNYKNPNPIPTPTPTPTPTPSPETKEVERIGGKDRDETAEKISKRFYDKSKYVIVARNDKFPDALTASLLAKALDCPILLNNPNTLEEGVKEEIKRLGADEIIMVGGRNALSVEVRKDLDKLDKDQVERIGGTDRFETSALIAKRVEGILGKLNKAIIASGLDYPDALASAPLAGKESAPILLTRKGEIPQTVAEALKDLGIKSVYIAGGKDAVEEKVEKALPTLIKRFNGSNRYATAVMIAKEVTDTPNYVFLASGENFPDALTIGPVAAKMQEPILLTHKNTLTQETKTYLVGTRLKALFVIGGRMAIQEAVVEEYKNMP